MSKRKKNPEGQLPGGPIARHGGYSVARKDELIRRRPEIQQYLKTIRRGLIRDICPEGEEHLTTARHIVLDRLMQKVATVRLIEAWLAENPNQILAAASVTGLWLSIDNGIRKDLLALGLDRKALEVEALTPDEILEEVGLEAQARRDAEKAAGPGNQSGGEEKAPQNAFQGPSSGKAGEEGD